MQVDKIHHDDPAHVAQTQLTSDLLGCPHVHVQGIVFLALSCTLAVATVHIDHVHGFRMLNDQISALSKGHILSKRGLDLPFNAKVFKKRCLAVVEAHHFGFLRIHRFEIAPQTLFYVF